MSGDSLGEDSWQKAIWIDETVDLVAACKIQMRKNLF